MNNKIEAQELQKYFSNKPLSGSQINDAYRIWRDSGLDAAKKYVDDMSRNKKVLFDGDKLRDEPVQYNVFGSDLIAENTIEQMDKAARLPIAIAGALMPDAHVGYGLPIGGVLATQNAVVPYAVGVDIACSVHISLYAIDPKEYDNNRDLFKSAVRTQTFFGAGCVHDGKNYHEVLDDDAWNLNVFSKELRQKALVQLGTSGGGNHFVDMGFVTIEKKHPELPVPGKYFAVVTHSGSRGVGSKIADRYTNIAIELHPFLDGQVRQLAWLDMNHIYGNEYWILMQLAGRFATANHETIHNRIAKFIRADVIWQHHNSHNFAWKEFVNGQECIVHRKGATPANLGQIGIIPGSMADKTYIVEGLGNSLSLNSSSHGAGRAMSRNQANNTIQNDDIARLLSDRKVELFGGGLDEAPQAYKPIDEVMKHQTSLVSILGSFEPRLVRMQGIHDNFKGGKDDGE